MDFLKSIAPNIKKNKSSKKITDEFDTNADQLFEITKWLKDMDFTWEMFRADPESGLCFSIENLIQLKLFFEKLDTELKNFWTTHTEKLLNKNYENFVYFQNQFYEYYDGVTVGRFLIARNYIIKDTIEMIFDDFEWRIFEIEIEKFMDQYPKSEWYKFISNYYPNVCHGEDKFGVEVNWEKVTLLDIESFFKHVPFQEILSFHIYSVESSERRVRKKMKETQNYNFRRLLIEDLENLSMKHFTPKVIELLQISAEIDEKHYPESLRAIFFIRTGTVFNVFWNAIVPFLNKTTSKKLIKINSSKLVNTLLDQVPDDSSWPNSISKSILGNISCKFNCSNTFCLPQGGEFPINKLPISTQDNLNSKKKKIVKSFKK